MAPSISVDTVDCRPNRAAASELVGVYLELAKARLALMVVLTALVGYVVAARGAARLDVLLWTVVGTALTAFGANILNQCWEMERDRRMERTRNRPLPAGRIRRSRAIRWGLGSCIIGLAVLSAGTNLSTAALALFVILLYVPVYTYLKTTTPLNTAVGAVCGAVPPMMGWTAATGRLDAGAWVLGGILFLWQIPHFLALAWMYRDDYARGGFRMVPSVDPSGSVTGRLALLYAAGLLPVSALVTWLGVSGRSFLVASQLLGGLVVVLAVRFLVRRSRPAARNLFLASILYLPLLLGVMVADMDDRIVSTTRAAGAAVLSLVTGSS